MFDSISSASALQNLLPQLEKLQLSVNEIESHFDNKEYPAFRRVFLTD